jgi:sec-independent protein translocase protein TatA
MRSLGLVSAAKGATVSGHCKEPQPREFPVPRVGFTELLVILAIVLLMFGSKKLPELADGMGKAIRNFKKGITSDDEEDVTPTDKQVTARSGATEVGAEAKTASGTPAERKS